MRTIQSGKSRENRVSPARARVGRGASVRRSERAIAGRDSRVTVSWAERGL